MRKKLLAVLLFMLVAFTFVVPAFADTEVATGEAAAVEATATVDSETALKEQKAQSSALIIAVVAAVGAAAMAGAIIFSVKSMARQPEAAGKIQSAMMLGLVFIETAIIYGLIVAILVIFVL